MKGRDSPLVYICSPYSGDEERNAGKARRFCRFAVDTGFVPVAPHLLFPQFLSEKTERETALEADLALPGVCSEIRVCGGEVSSGMQLEIEHAEKAGIPVRYVKEEELCTQ